MLLVVISFIGIYVYKDGKMTNIMKEFKLGLDLEGGRQILLSPSDETKTVYISEDGNQLDSLEDLSDEEKEKYIEEEVNVNPEDILNIDNYEQAKKIFKSRIDNSAISEYRISLNQENGQIIINAGEQKTIDNVIYTIFQPGKFTIKDSETQELLLSNSDIKNANVGYNPTQEGTSIYLTINFNKDGAKKLEDISRTYIKTTDDDGNETTKRVTLAIDGQTISNSYFGEPMTNGVLQLTIGSATKDVDELQTYIINASNIANILSTGATNIEYEIEENEFIGSAITENLIGVLLLAAIAIIASMLAYLFVEYKERGIVAGISFIGYIATLLLILRLTNVVITIEAIGAIAISIIFYYAFLIYVLLRINKYKENSSTPKAEINKALKTSLLILVPAYVISIVFSLITYVAISSLGTSLFWGISIFVIYTFLITKPLMLNFEYLFEEK